MSGVNHTVLTSVELPGAGADSGRRHCWWIPLSQPLHFLPVHRHIDKNESLTKGGVGTGSQLDGKIQAGGEGDIGKAAVTEWDLGVYKDRDVCIWIDN